MPRTKFDISTYKTFFSASPSRKGFADLCSGFVNSGHSISGHALVFDGNAKSLLAHLTSGRRKFRGFQVDGKSVNKIRVRSTIAQLTDQSARAYVLDSVQPGIIWIIGFSDEVQYLSREIEKYSSRISQFFVKSIDFWKISENLKTEGYIKNTFVNDYSAYFVSKNDGLSEKRRVWPSPAVPLSRLAPDIAESSLRLRSIHLTFTKKQNASIRLRRNLSFSCDKDFSFIFEEVLPKFLTLAVERSRVFENRGFRQTDTNTSRPLKISYQSNLFKDKRNNHRLIETIREIDGAALSVYHGNPYLHASYIDYIDGSSCTIWITDADSVALIPRGSMSVASLERLTNQILLKFGEGELMESDSHD